MAGQQNREKKHFFTIYTNAVKRALFYKALEFFFWATKKSRNVKPSQASTLNIHNLPTPN